MGYKYLFSAFCLMLVVTFQSCGPLKDQKWLGNLTVKADPYKSQAHLILEPLVMRNAAWAMKQMPVTVTAMSSLRSAGTKNDFYSEGDYWWPDPQNPDGPYIQRDGMTNPDNFVAHRQAMIRFSKIVGALAAAYKLTGDKKYAVHAALHLEAWFINPETLMNPNLQFAQAIKGRFTGRGIGIIDTIQLMEVAQGVLVMQDALSTASVTGSKKWFAQYLDWLMSHPYGKTEMAALNNHGTCFIMQVASFAKLTDDLPLLRFCRERFKTVLLPDQMAEDGSFPREMSRTKPYGYSIFNLDAMATLCQILTTKEDDMWNYTSANGRSIRKGIYYLHPFVADKTTWPLKPDVMYWSEWPVAQPFLLFGASAFQDQVLLNTWAGLDHDPQTEEIIRNLPIRNPLIWI